MNQRKSSGSLVYSTDSGRMCPGCGRPIAACTCRRPAPAAPGDGVVRVSREKAGRGGKEVTLVRGVALDGAALAAMGKRLKTHCGTGGTVKEGVIELQGDHGVHVIELLTAEGWKVKRAGG